MAALGVSAAVAAGLVPGLVSASAAGAAESAYVQSADPGAQQYDPQARPETAEAIALAEARDTGENVEVESLRSEAGEVFATPEGELEAYEYLRPVWARVDGEWQAVDTDLQVRDDGTIAPRAAAAQLTFSGGGDGALVELERSGRQLALEWPGTLPEPELVGNVAIYHDILPDVDLRLEAQPDGFSQLIVVNSAEAAANPALTQLHLGLDTAGVETEVTEDGGIEALDANADSAVFEAPVPLMWDSSGGSTDGAARAEAEDDAPVGEPGAGESGNLARVGAQVNVEQDTLTLTPDEEVLLGEDTVYPVYIDPQWHTPRSAAWTMVSRYWADSPQWKFNGDSNAGMGYCGWAGCKPQDLKRLMYRLPTDRFAGTRILSAEFSVRNVHSTSCEPQDVELWRTGDIGAGTTWNSQDNSSFWVQRLATESFAYGYEGCAQADAEFDVSAAVQAAADSGRSTLTFGLKAGDESDPLSWKRFSDQAHLRVRYNRVPDQVRPAQLVMEYGGVCKTSDNAARVRRLGRIFANNVTDPDGDSVAVEFAARWDAGDGRGDVVRWESGLTTARESGAQFGVDLPDDLPGDTDIEWAVRAYDGSSYSRWSSTGTGNYTCHFVHDVSVPAGPDVSSAHYPASDPSDPLDAWYQGTGHYGAFTLTAADDDVSRYRYALDADPPESEVATTQGAPQVVNLVPPKPGLHFITAQAVDGAGHVSETTTYQFRVTAGASPRGSWQMDEAAGATAAEPATQARWATVHGGTTLGVEGAVGTAAHFDGTSGYLSTDGPVIGTNSAFSVSAWVKLDEKPDSAAVIATQTGTFRPGFELYYSAAQDSWAFNQYRSDQDGDNSTARVLASGVEVVAGRWTHLVGSYDPGGGLLRLFVDGQLAGTAAYSNAWNARGPVQIGAGRSGDQNRSFFPGAIDEVQIFDLHMASEATHVAKLYNKERLHDSGRPAVALFPLDEQSGQRVSASSDVLPATFHGGAEAGDEGVRARALRLNGTDGYADTGTALVNTGRNFAISAWVKLDSKPGSAAVVATQTGTYAPGLELYYSAANDRWAFDQYSDDSPDASPVRAMQPEGESAQAGVWTHLVGVHDAYQDSLTLYVNGEKAGTAALDTPFNATGPVQIGAGRYNGALGAFFPGTIDDVRLFDRILTDYEVQQIYHQAPRVQARWQLDTVDSEDVPSMPDATSRGNDLFLWGGAGASPGFVDEASLYVDGGGGYAYTPSVPVDTSTSFTVMGFVRAASPPSEPASVLSAVGRQESAFAIRFIPDASQDGFGRWEVTLADQDSPEANVTHVAHQRLYDVREWHHLALVHDGFAARARLYVDGELEEVTCLDAEDSTCSAGASWADNVFPFQATSSLHLGRSMTDGVWREPWPGALDDVWLVQGVLSDEQIRHFSLGLRDAPTAIPQTE
ncbi:LamG-like jellyroll fold domain-containing protein [Streptomyces hoynatensis]|uniref:LamG-like jellyroll fold domain-containing protein n=1 Tax=Streptomyces hoynatensis TaxID=1141874 RepID=UPI0030C82076